MIVFESAGFSYSPDSAPALVGVTLRIRPEERVAVMGANGSGKSTFALLAAGLLQPTQGTVDIGSDRGCGIVFQNPDNQIVSISVERELAFPLECGQVDQPTIRKQVDGAMNRFGFLGRADQSPNKLSGGEKQKLAIASAVIAGPGALVLDEPTAHLDQEGCRLMHESIKAVQEEHPELILIIVTQSPTEAMLCSRLLALKNGRIAADSAPSMLLTNPDLCRDLNIPLHSASVLGDLDISNLRSSSVSYHTLLNDTNDQREIPATASPGKSDKSLSATPLVSLIDIEFGWGRESPVFRSLNLQLRRNAVTGVAARSGGGKTTLATMLAGLQRPTNGSIHWLGSKADEDHLLRSVGYLLQFPERQIFCETVADEIKFGLTGLKLSAIDADIRIRESLRLAGLDSDSFIDRSPFRLSGGEMRKVALASVLALQRPLIIYDEPVAELDWESRRRFVSVVKEVSLSGVTQVVISHDSDFLFEVCDDLILLSEGVAKYAGAKFQLADNPAVFEECGVSVPAVISLCIERSCADCLVHYRISSVAELVEKLQHGA